MRREVIHVPAPYEYGESDQAAYTDMRASTHDLLVSSSRCVQAFPGISVYPQTSRAGEFVDYLQVDHRRLTLPERQHMTGLETPIVPIVVGAIIGFVPNYVMDVRRERSLRRSRWDSPLFELCSEFASVARAFQELCLRRAADPGAEALIGDINDEHQRLRTLSERLRLLGDLELQLAVRWIVRHAYAVREVAEGRPETRPRIVHRPCASASARRFRLYCSPPGSEAR